MQGKLLNFGWSVQEKSPHGPYLLVTSESLTGESTRAGASETAAPQGRGQTEAGDKNQLGVEEKSEQQPSLGQRSFYKGKQHAVIISWSISREPQASTAHLTRPIFGAALISRLTLTLEKEVTDFSMTLFGKIAGGDLSYSQSLLLQSRPLSAKADFLCLVPAQETSFKEGAVLLVRR